MSNCQKEMRYDILHKIMQSVQFQKKRIRQSFVQEILNTADQSTYKREMQKYINNEMGQDDRIIEICRADINTTVVEKIALEDSQI